MKNLVLILMLVAIQCCSAFPQNYDEEGEYAVDIPDFISESEAKELEAGDLMRLYCQLNGKTTVPLMWVKKGEDNKGDKQLALNGMVLARNPGARLQIRTMDGNDGEILTLRDFKEENAGTYECRIMAETPKSIQFDVSLKKEEAKPESSGEDESTTSEVKDNDPNSAQQSKASLVLSAFLVSIVMGIQFQKLKM